MQIHTHLWRRRKTHLHCSFSTVKANQSFRTDVRLLAHGPFDGGPSECLWGVGSVGWGGGGGSVDQGPSEVSQRQEHNVRSISRQGMFQIWFEHTRTAPGEVCRSNSAVWSTAARGLQFVTLFGFVELQISHLERQKQQQKNTILCDFNNDKCNPSGYLPWTLC